jgi:uncharacterized protein YidB (DUF937 family)
MATDMERTIESGLNQLLGRSGDQAIDLPEWATPMIMGVIGAVGGKAVGGAVGGSTGGNIAAILGGVLGGAAGSGALDDVIGKFTGAGAGEQAKSWVSTGPNQPVDPQAVQQALGPDTIAKIAAETGRSPEEVQQALATLMPKVVDTMTPQGVVPDPSTLATATSAASAAGSATGG